MPLYNGYQDNYESYSRCKKSKAMRNYRCEVTGRTIQKGEEYYYLTCWNPVKNKRFTFRFCLSVPSKIRNFYRRYPEESKEQLSLPKPVLGFFNQQPERGLDNLEEIMERLLEQERRRIIFNF